MSRKTDSDRRSSVLQKNSATSKEYGRYSNESASSYSVSK